MGRAYGCRGELWSVVLSGVGFGLVELGSRGAMKRSKTQSEFGGRSGLIQSAEDGHIEMTSPESLMALYATDPADEGAVPDREMVGERSRQWDVKHPG